MGNIENLKVWNESIDLAKNIYLFVENTPRLKQNFWLRDQLQRSVVSIWSNIAEWWNRWSSKDFTKFLYIARWSCSELKTQLIIIKEIWYIDEVIFRKLIEQIEYVHKMINWLIKSLN